MTAPESPRGALPLDEYALNVLSFGTSEQGYENLIAQAREAIRLRAEVERLLERNDELLLGNTNAMIELERSAAAVRAARADGANEERMLHSAPAERRAVALAAHVEALREACIRPLTNDGVCKCALCGRTNINHHGDNFAEVQHDSECALAAHVEALRGALLAAERVVIKDAPSAREHASVADAVRLALARTPAQSLAALRASVRSEAFAEAAAAIRSNVASLWPSGVSFVQDAKSHGAENAAMWIEPLAQKGANDAEA